MNKLRARITTPNENAPDAPLVVAPANQEAPPTEGKPTGLRAPSRRIKLPVFDIEIETVPHESSASGRITSSLHATDEPRDSPYNTAADAIESMILAHAIAGVDVGDNAYIEGIEEAVTALANHAPEAGQTVPSLATLKAAILRHQKHLAGEEDLDSDDGITQAAAMVLDRIAEDAPEAGHTAVAPENLLQRIREAMNASVGENRHENMAEMEEDPEKWDSVLEAGCDGFEDGWKAAIQALEEILASAPQPAP